MPQLFEKPFYSPKRATQQKLHSNPTAQYKNKKGNTLKSVAFNKLF
jgi:hypothetical protein